ncbi:SLBB domain-containing protein [Insolitispirillum peregrinum]|uniref:Protein involved in polysaccharide export, contains SLBB domain of the beta-grasp fold n=1 Tax=Insolitispirillum peregrinum TaxID=80876 RepID=A0A1N7JDF0_9PROT|nr:SLBB domain-containing protein [Insolitispirillum peregrinum]SIS47335.1 protein involved in polysaccharide export, contains SLBB domain of the beta-grasp fold [Insolitispirillum peregrinum]
MVRLKTFAALALALLCGVSGTAFAQQRPDDLLLQFQQRLQQGDANEDDGGSGQNPVQDQTGGRGTTLTPQQDLFSPASPIELAYRKRFQEFDQTPSVRLPSDMEQEQSLKQLQKSGKWSFNLKQIGYDVLQVPAGAPAPRLLGGVSDSYILGIGDQLSITLRGQTNSTRQLYVGRDGQVILPNLPPVVAAGRSFADFRSDLEAQVASSLLETQVFVTLGSVRQLSILVGGEVSNPGMVTVSSLSSVIDALAAAKGINKTGTLRAVQLIRDGQTHTLDLYPVLLGIGKPEDMALREGDRIVVPPVGPTVAVFAAVSRPGIYEIKGGSLPVQEALRFAGGALSADGQRFVRISLGPDGRGGVSETTSAKGTLKRGDMLGVITRSGGTRGAIYLSGHVTSQGWISLSASPSLRALLADRSLLRNEPYLPFVVVKRQNAATMATEYKGVDGAHLQRGGEDFPLQDQDQVIILSQNEIRYLNSYDVSQVLAGSDPAYGFSASDWANERNKEKELGQAQTQTGRANGNAQAASGQQDGPSLQQDPTASLDDRRVRKALKTCEGLRFLANEIAEKGTLTIDLGPQEASPPRNVQPCPDIYDKYPALLSFVLHHAMSVSGAIYRPGRYPVSDEGFLADILAAAGGATGKADPDGVEVTQLRDAVAMRQKIPLALAQSDFLIGPSASVVVAERFTNIDGGLVTLGGEVRHPGRYALLRGERLSQLLSRAGGLTDEAYVLGAVFRRDSIKAEEQSSYEALAHEIEMAIPTMLQQQAAFSEKSNDGQTSMMALQQLVRSLRSAKAAGRMVIDADPAALQSNPESDVVLQAGDALYVPKRPSHVMISGEVMHPGAQRFESGLAAEEYIQRAGGLRDSADESHAFIILPNGSAQPLSTSSWNYRETFLPPGSTIVVPRDLNPALFWSFTRDALGIFSNMAISAAALASIND